MLVELVSYHLHVIQVCILVWLDLIRKDAAKHVLDIVPIIDEIPFLLLFIAPLLIPFLLFSELFNFLHFHLVQQLLHIPKMGVLDLKLLLVFGELLRIVSLVIIII